MAKICSDSGTSLFETVPCVVLFVDDDAIIGAANPFALKVLDFTEDDISGRPLTDIIDFGSAGKGSDLCDQIEAASKDGFVSVKLKNGQKFLSKISIGERVECHDNIARRVICVHDNGQLKLLLDQHLEYRNLLDTALVAIPDAFAIYDQDDRLQIFNHAYQSYYEASKDVLKVGVKFEEIIKHGIENGQYPEAGNNAESQAAWLKQRLDAHNNPSGPIIQKTNNRWLRIEERRLEDGRIAGIRADITQLMETKSVAEALGNILDNIAVPIFFTDLETFQCEYANKACLEKLKYSEAEFRRLSPNDLRVDPVGSGLETFIQKIVSNKGSILTDRALYKMKDGTSFPARVSSMCEMGERTKRIITLIEDETQALEMRDALERQQAEREAILENVPAFITRSKPDTTMKYANDTYAAYFDRLPEDIIGQKFIDFVPEASKQQVLSNIESFSPENPQHSFEQPMQNSSGEQAVILWTNRMIFKGGKPFEIVSVGRDITPQKNAQAQIQQQAHDLALRNRALEQFAGIVSHDLRSPLRHIRLFGEMLLEEHKSGKLDNISQYLGIVTDKIHKMDRMIISLLEFSQVAYREVNPREFKLSEAISEAQDILSDKISKNGATITLENDIVLNLDFVLFVRVVQNLLDNALKYQNQGATPDVTIRAQVDEKVISLSFCDNGIGIDAQQSERIFNALQRLHVDESEYEGTGIGLALVKRIVEGHNGDISLDTDFQNGAKFDLTFPNNA